MINKGILAKIAFNSLLGAVAIFFWLKFVNLEDIKATLTTVKPLLLLPIFLTIWLSISVRAFRLKLFLKPIAKIKLTEIILLGGVSVLLNFLIPIRAGDIGRGVYLSRSYHLPVAKSLTWIFIDRFIDILVLLLLAPPLLLIVPNNLGSLVGIYALGLSFVALFVAYLMTYQSNLAKGIFSVFNNFLVFPVLKRNFSRFYLHMLESFEVLKRSTKDLFGILAVTFLAYLLDGATFYLAFSSIAANVSYLKTFLAQFLNALAFLIPAAPGYVGSAEASGLVVFSLILGIDKNLASSMILIYHAILAVFIIGYGVFCLYALDLNPLKLLRRTKELD